MLLLLLLLLDVTSLHAAPPFPTSAWANDPPALIELGRLLFYDRALSSNDRMACADCHRQALAFSDGLVVARGATGELHRHNTPGLANVAWMASLGWSDPFLWRLEAQHRIPLFGRAPLELGLSDPLPESLVARLAKEPRYRALRTQLATSATINAEYVVTALAAFVRSLVSYRSPFDAWLYEDSAAALSPDARAGFALFTSARLGCGECHAGFLIGGAVRSVDTQQSPVFEDNGLPISSGDAGLAEHTGNATDTGRFRVPSLRNVALTAPYMHDGSLPTLDAVLTHYERAGADSGQTSRLRLFRLSLMERAQLLAFLAALTDEHFVRDPNLADPW